jgi:hypothetical protein
MIFRELAVELSAADPHWNVEPLLQAADIMEAAAPRMKASDSQVAGGHYKAFAIQPSEFIHRNRLGFLEGNVIKYVCRHRAKNGRQDIEKAIHYLQLLLEWEYGP